MPSVALSSTQLNVVRRGEGEPLLLIQGMGGTHLSWGDEFLDALGEDLDVIGYDHRNTGRSGRDEDELRTEVMADDAAGLLDALELDSAHVLGISMGGMVAQELALRHPSRVRTLTLGCTWSGGPGVQRPDPELWRDLFEAQQSGDRERALRATFEMNLSAEWTAAEGAYEAFRSMVLALPVAPAVIARQLQAVLAFDASARLGEIEAPTLVVHGTEDRVVPPANGEQLAGAIGGARLEWLHGAGHMFWWEQPERSAELLRAHVAR
ncbi:MAG: alpha/beta fold hydrolase [Solirubrobacteraceae bacterium]